MGGVKRKRVRRFRRARCDICSRIKASGFVFALAVLLFAGALPGRSIASEPNRSEIDADWSGEKPRGPRPAADDTKAIARLIDDIDAAVKRDKRRTLSVITINTDVAATTLEEQKARTGFSFGEIYVAHSLALSTRKKFNAIVALKKSGQSWAQIARGHKVRLKGSTELLRELTKQ
jgi:hypothetical protein